MSEFEDLRARMDAAQHSSDDLDRDDTDVDEPVGPDRTVAVREVLERAAGEAGRPQASVVGTQERVLSVMLREAVLMQAAIVLVAQRDYLQGERAIPRDEVTGLRSLIELAHPHVASAKTDAKAPSKLDGWTCPDL